jgi:thiol-disulfide isomerase/thioredoxin
MTFRNKVRIIAFVILIGGLIGIALTVPNSSNKSNPNTNENLSNQNNDDDNSSNEIPNEVENKLEKRFLPYDEAYLNLSSDYRIVLFFHADWCPTCLALERDLKRNINSIPDDLLILKASYGNNGETDLAKKYNVKVQHTLIQLDKNAKPIKTWIGSFRLEEVIDELI